jgi:hypothetical protein
MLVLKPSLHFLTLPPLRIFNGGRVKKTNGIIDEKYP